jgi:hypothetical protein
MDGEEAGEVPEREGVGWREPATRRAAPGGRRATTGQGRLDRPEGRTASELERRDGRATRLRSRAESVIQRVKRLL